MSLSISPESIQQPQVSVWSERDEIDARYEAATEHLNWYGEASVYAAAVGTASLMSIGVEPLTFPVSALGASRDMVLDFSQHSQELFVAGSVSLGVAAVSATIWGVGRAINWGVQRYRYGRAAQAQPID